MAEVAHRLPEGVPMERAPGNAVRCEVCKVAFENRNQKAWHLAIVHGVRVRRLDGRRVTWCSFCGTPFFAKKHKEAHIRIAHPVVDPYSGKRKGGEDE